MAPTIWYFIKFFEEESYADEFMAGRLYLNTLAYFKQQESECGDGRTDATEAIAMWWQPDDIVMKLTVPGVGDTVIAKSDLAAPVSASYKYRGDLNILCLYAIYSIGFESINGKFHCSSEEAEELQRQVTIDERCLQFGGFAVVINAAPFMSQLCETLKRQGYRFVARLVEYYDEEIFHGEIPLKEIPFRKQKRFKYQEFRLCVYPRIFSSAAITINIGDLSRICGKVESARLPTLFKLRQETPPSGSR